jgi:adenylate kinase
MKKLKIIFLGMQGSGKSTQAKMLAEKLSVPYVEMGQLLRDKSKDSDEIAKKIQEALTTGKLVENQITIDCLKEKLNQPGFENGYVLDGYPRNKSQLSALDADISKVFYIKVSDNEAVSRLISRGRHDDSPSLIVQRLKIYHEETEPLLKHFKDQRILEEIYGEKSIDQVSEDIEKKLENI